MKNKPLFYKIYFSVIAVFLVLLIIGLFVLNSVLKAYEAAQPAGYMNAIITEYLQEADLYGAAQKYGISLSKYESENDVNAAFKSLIAKEKLTIASSGKKLEGYNEVYNVKAGEKVLLTFFLKKAEKGGKFGIKGYEVGFAECDKDIYKHYEVRVPSDVKLLINGVEVAKDDRVDLKLPEILTNKIGDKQVVTHQTFKLDNFISNKFDIKAYAADGSEVIVSETNGVYTVAQGIEATELDGLKTHALNASQAYAKFMQEDAGLGLVANYFDTSTEFYSYIRKTLRFVWDHNSYRFEDVTFDEAHKYTDTLYSCRVRFTQVLNRGNLIYKDYFDKYVYIEKTSKGLKVIDVQTPNSK